MTVIMTEILLLQTHLYGILAPRQNILLWPLLSEHQTNRQYEWHLVYCDSQILPLEMPSSTDFVFFYDITDTAMNITTSGTGVQGTAAGTYLIEDAVDADGDALTGTDLPTVAPSGVITLPASFASESEFYLKVTFTKGASPDTASYTRRYRFKK